MGKLKGILQLARRVLSVNTEFLGSKESHFHFISLVTSLREQKLGLQAATPRWGRINLPWESNPGEIKIWIAKPTPGRFLDRAAKNIRAAGWAHASAERLPGRRGSCSAWLACFVVESLDVWHEKNLENPADPKSSLRAIESLSRQFCKADLRVCFLDSFPFPARILWEKK